MYVCVHMKASVHSIKYTHTLSLWIGQILSFIIFVPVIYVLSSNLSEYKKNKNLGQNNGLKELLEC